MTMRRLLTYVALVLALLALSTVPVVAQELFKNNATSTLASGISSSATSLSVQAGHGSRFPAAVSGTSHFYATLQDGGTIEIVKVTARATDTFTIERGQDGSTAVAWSAGARIEQRITAASLTGFRQSMIPIDLVGDTTDTVLPTDKGGTGTDNAAAHEVLVGHHSGTLAWVKKTLPDCTSGKLTYNQATGVIACGTDAFGAPATATYITQTPDSGLSAEQALSALATGIVKVTTTTGVLSTAVAADFPTLNQNTTGTAAALAANPTDCSSGQFANAIDASGNLTCGTPDGGSDPWTVVKKTDADQTSTANSTTLANITSLTFAMTASTDYLLDCTILYSGNTATNGLGLTIDLSGTVTSIAVDAKINGIAADGAAAQWSGQITADVDPVLGSGVAAVNTVYTAHLRGIIRNDASADNATVQFRNEVAVASNTVTVRTGSQCMYRTY